MKILFIFVILMFLAGCEPGSVSKNFAKSLLEKDSESADQQTEDISDAKEDIPDINESTEEPHADVEEIEKDNDVDYTFSSNKISSEGTFNVAIKRVYFDGKFLNVDIFVEDPYKQDVFGNQAKELIRDPLIWDGFILNGNKLRKLIMCDSKKIDEYSWTSNYCINKDDIGDIYNQLLYFVYTTESMDQEAVITLSTLAKDSDAFKYILTLRINSK